MRYVLETLIVLVVLVLAGVFFLQQRTGKQDMGKEARVRDELRLLYERTSYHAALQYSETLDHDEFPTTEFPAQIDPAWFGGRQPGNVLASDEHPWLDVAPPGDLGLHPPDPVLSRSEQAGVWYNPNNGIFRARTPVGAGDEMTLALYNRINGTALGVLPRDTASERRPLAYVPGHVPGATLASPGHGGAVMEVSRTGDPGGALFAPVEFKSLRGTDSAPDKHDQSRAPRPRRTLRAD